MQPYLYRVIALAIAAGLVAWLARPAPVAGFTQSGAASFIGAGVPMGHEWITRMAGMEVLGGDAVIKPDPNDPRKTWTKGLAKNLDLAPARREVDRVVRNKTNEARYASTYDAIFAAIVGERWVDIAGFNVGKAQLGAYNCFEAAAQEPADVQYDHFMRRWDDRGGDGAASAVQRARERFISYFVAAAMAPRGVITAWDGGASSALATVDRNYFLFGRAVHVLQDSFSSEHTVRVDADNYERVRQIKSSLCAAGAEQHGHSSKAVTEYLSGDVIWKPRTRFEPGWASYKASHMRPVALAATEAMKDAWAAFLRTMAKDDATRADAARKEARQLAANWLDGDRDEIRTWYDDEAHRDATYVLADGQRGKGQSVAACMKGLGDDSQAARAQRIEDARRICLYNIVPVLGFADAQDPALKMPYNWQWRAATWQMPPADWKIPDVKVPAEIKVAIKSRRAQHYMVAPDGVANDQWIYVKPGARLSWIVVGDRDHAIFRSSDAPLFLSYRLTTGAVKLYASATDAEYKLDKRDGKYTIFNLRYKDYLWLDGASPYVSGKGDPKQDTAQWDIDGLPGNW